MLELGKISDLVIVKKVDFGVYLSDPNGDNREERVLLPKKQVPAGASEGDHVEVFLYKDSSDRLIATTNTPKLTIGDVALLKVLETGRIGAFLDWGLEKNLLLPFREQTIKVKAGDQVLVGLYVDKSDRLCASMKVYPYLRTDSPYKKDDMVTGRVYEVTDTFGVFVAVDDQYSALIPKKEAQGRFLPGQQLSLRVINVREDGKLTLSPHQKAYLQMEDDAGMILAAIEKMGGTLPFDDKAEPNVISEKFGMSKAAFKRAVGRLLKERKIEIKGGKIISL